MIKHNLNFDWKYLPAFSEEYLLADFDDAGFSCVNIPHTNLELPYNNFNEESYQFVSTYRKTLEVTAEMLKKRLVLEFEGAAVFAEVYVNGEFAFSHKGAYTSFRHEINPHLLSGRNVIAVKLDSTERPEIPPFGGVVDYLVYGGIYREVALYEYDDVYVDALKVYTYDVLKKPKISAEVVLNKPVAEETSAKITVKDFNGDTVTEYNFEFDEDEDKKTLTLDPDGIKLWDLENPVLYTLTAKVGTEERTVRFGFREARFTKNGFYLNGQPLKLRGLNRHQSYPYAGYAMPKSAQYADAELLKNHLGLNIVRTSHYPNSRHFLDRCDEIGLLVFTEIPGWQHISTLPEWRGLVLENVAEMISDGFNHPSIIMWGVRINESGDDHELFSATNALARGLDPSRQTGGVRVRPFSEFLEDVYTTNDFTHAGKKKILMPKPLIGGAGKPYLVTEYNGHMYPAKSFDNEGTRQEHALRHARVLNTMYKRRGTSGSIGWCMSDYNTHKDFGSGDKICYHGVTDMFRIDKTAAWAYRSQSDTVPFLECSSNFEIGDHPGGKVGKVWLFTNCDEIKVYKNNDFIGTLDVAQKAKKSPFRHLPHPLILLDDVIGDQLITKEGFSAGKARTVKKLLSGIFTYGTFGGILRRLWSAIKCVTVYGLGISGITGLFGRYASTWGSTQTSYRFEGIKNGNKVCEVSKGSVFKTHLEVKADTLNLCEDDTYDTVRVTVRAVSQLGNVLPYANDTIEVSVADGLEIIGPDNFSLVGGVRAFWLKTKGKAGVQKVKISSALGEETLSFEVIKKPL